MNVNISITKNSIMLKMKKIWKVMHKMVKFLVLVLYHLVYPLRLLCKAFLWIMVHQRENGEGLKDLRIKVDLTVDLLFLEKILDRFFNSQPNQINHRKKKTEKSTDLFLKMLMFVFFSCTKDK